MIRFTPRPVLLLILLVLLGNQVPIASIRAASVRSPLVETIKPLLGTVQQISASSGASVLSRSAPNLNITPANNDAHAERQSSVRQLTALQSQSFSQTTCDSSIDRTNGKTAIADSVYGGAQAQYALDNNTSTYWGGGVRGSGWIYVDFGASTPFRLSRIKFTINTSGGYSPVKEYDVEYSSNATTWILVHSGEVPSSAGHGYVEDQSWNAPSTAYRYWRLKIRSVNGPWEPSVSELEYYEPTSCTPPPPPSPCDQTIDRTTDKVAIADSTWTSANYAIDDNLTTYWGSRTRGSGWIYVDFGATSAIQAGRMKFIIDTYDTGGGYYSPIKDYDISYSSDAVTWTTIYSNSIPTTAGHGYVEDKSWQAPPTGYRY